MGGLARIAAVVCLSAFGCHSSPPDVPAHLVFPERTDPVVLAVPSVPPASPAPGGQLDADIRSFPERGGRLADPLALASEQRAELATLLASRFGTPSLPHFAVSEVDIPLARELGLRPDHLSEGIRLYRRHCLQCHGSAGDGRGPTGQWIHPHPRDFRQGLFKFISTPMNAAGKPARVDLRRTLREGLPGTAMPAFGLLGDDEIERLTEAVTFLSIRGELEMRLLVATLVEGEADVDWPRLADEWLGIILRQWQAAQPLPLPATLSIPADDDSLRRGWRLLTRADGTGCIQCHEDLGRKAAWRYDAWGAAVRPANLTVGVVKGGRRPEEIAHRIRCGIAPSGMPAAVSLDDQELADLVNLVLALSRPGQLPADIRLAVTGSTD